MSRNLIVIVGLMAVSSAYLWISPWLMPGTDAILIAANLIAAPFVVGFLGGYLMVGRLLPKLLVLLLVPIVHNFVYGEDPAKPGLENLVALLEVLPLWLGGLIAHMLVSKRLTPATKVNEQA
jgi:hypothetical protein